MTKRQNKQNTKRKHDKKAERQKDKRQRPKREFNIVTSGQFCTLAMFSFWLLFQLHFLSQNQRSLDNYRNRL